MRMLGDRRRVGGSADGGLVNGEKHAHDYASTMIIMMEMKNKIRWDVAVAYR
jgi:hypothetical protein